MRARKLNKVLDMRKLSARWVSRLLTPDNKYNHKKKAKTVISAVMVMAVVFCGPQGVFHVDYLKKVKTRFCANSPYLVPCDLFLFTNLGKSLAAHNF